MSHVLLGQIFDSYRLPNFREDGGFGHRHSEGRVAEAADDFSGGMSGATLQEAFVSDEHQEISNAVANLPCGCGDCCAPKLLAEASRRGLVPLSIAEVWMGVPTAKEGYRQEGSFYGACRGRCRPILGHMLCGADKLRLIDPSADAILIYARLRLGLPRLCCSHCVAGLPCIVLAPQFANHLHFTAPCRRRRVRILLQHFVPNTR